MRSCSLPLQLSKHDLDVTSNIVEAECVTIGRLKRGVSVDTARSELEVSMAAFSRITCGTGSITDAQT